MSDRSSSATVSRSVPDAPNRILVIEDNPPDVLLIEEALRAQELNFSLIHCQDGEEALSRVLSGGAREPFALVILDLNMPRVGGLQVLQALRSNAALAHIPVMILTSSLAMDEREQAQRLGATRFVRKPTDLYEFLSQVGGAAAELLQVPAPNRTDLTA